jgi:Helix-turn-helix domain
VTVGESLTQARYQAGLTIDELSERTKIRSTVIRSIEADDYAACGGDLYVRGYVRAIAGAVGVDAQGLIRAFDRERVHAGDNANATVFDLPAVPALDAEPPASQDPDVTRFDLPPVRDDSAATRFDIPPVRADHTEDLMAAGYEVQPAAGGAGTGLVTPPAGTGPQAAPAAAGASPRSRRDGRRLLVGVAAVIVLALAGVVGVRLASGPATASSTITQAVGATAKASKSASPATSAAADSKPAAKATPTPSAKPTPTKKPVHVTPRVTLLPVAAAEAFGPGGLGDGDNPSGAGYTIASNPPLPWSTNWYASAQFGMLKSGTGLLLQLSRQSTITSVRVDLTHYRGVNLQLKVGDGTDPQDFKVVATADNTGGTVRLRLRHPASARYLLIWFTLLPPNGVGQYQESVYHVMINGHR